MFRDRCPHGDPPKSAAACAQKRTSSKYALTVCKSLRKFKTKLALHPAQTFEQNFKRHLGCLPMSSATALNGHV